jgi:predicted alpha/beta hydrolase
MYHLLASKLAERGIAVFTFDYRGIGGSRHGRLRGFAAGMEHWGRDDFGAALALAAREFPDLAVDVIGHSIGNLMVGAAPLASRMGRIVMLAPHTGYWRDYGPKWRWALYLTWHVLMPTVTKIVGYFPGRALGLGEDLPRSFALDWARRRQPPLMVTARDRYRFQVILEGYGKLHCPTLALSVTDDTFAPPAAAKRLLAVYPNLAVTQETISPSDLAQEQLGHFAFLRRPVGPWFWNRISAWLLQTGSVGRASNHGASSSVVPPSGTKGRAPAGSTALF